MLIVAATAVADPCPKPAGPYLPICPCECADGAPGPDGPPGDAGATGTSVNVGSGVSHNNMQPYLGMNYIIALIGLFPSRSGRDAEALFEPLIGNIMMFAGNFAPRGWAFCDGQLLPISDNQALFSILGTQYGGDGRTTFGLPDMRGRTGMHEGSGPGLTPRNLGQKMGTNSESISVGEMPRHNHNE